LTRQHVVRLLSASLAAWVLCVSFAVAQSKPPVDPDTVYNVQSHIYHRESCTSARRCTKNCVTIKLSEAKKRGGRPCQICGGPSTTQDDRHENLDAFAAGH
jgi:methylphosphotriester-DNA--protein-cysteine methyltransferase